MVNNTPKTKPIVEMQPILKPCFKIKRGHWKTCRAKNAPYLGRTSPYPPFHWVPPRARGDASVNQELYHYSAIISITVESETRLQDRPTVIMVTSATVLGWVFCYVLDLALSLGPIICNMLHEGVKIRHWQSAITAVELVTPRRLYYYFNALCFHLQSIDWQLIARWY